MNRRVSSDHVTERLKRSMDSLQRLYTIVTGLSFGVAISGLLVVPTVNPVQPQTSPVGVDLRFSALPMFVTLLFTVIPFYHGANRYLDDAYIFTSREGTPPRLAAVVDVVFFVSEAIVFYAMAAVLPSGSWFYRLYLGLLVLDVVWLVLVYFYSRKHWPRVKRWLWANSSVAAITGILILTPLLPEDLSRWIYVMLVSIVRTIVDYATQWTFYFPES